MRGLEPYQSGMVISADGHILTAWSYVLDTDYITVTLDDGRKYQGELKGYDPRLEIAVLKRDKYGRSAERTARLVDQMELQLEELVADAAEDEARAEQAAEKTTKVASFERRKPVKKPFPDHLPRERVEP